MAMSFSRPDPSSPASVADAAFGTGRRGFDQGEVRDFLRMVAAELGRLQERERFLERELRTAQSSPDLSSAKLDDEALTRLLGEETARVLQTARESAHEIRERAEGSAGRVLSEASDEARRLREEAEVESARRRADAAADAEAELDMAKQQGREMVNEARAYRERVLSELARRRELAREQIEQLIHGRDRLMQAFERARLVAVDIVSEMQPLGEPDEYVNLEPTTGPVPVMVVNSALPEVSDPEAGAGAAGGDTDADADIGDDADTDTDNEAPVSDAVDDAELEPEGAAGEAADGVAVDDALDVLVEQTDDDALASADEAESDDVVVDLFARIRADAVPPDDADAARPADEEDDGESTDESPAAAVDDDSTDLEADTGVAARASEEATGDATDDEAAPTPFEQRDEDLTPLIVASAKKLKRVLADEQNGVLDALRRHHPVRDLDDLLPPAGEHAARYGDAISGDLLLAAQAGAASAASGRAAKLSKTAGNDAVRVAGDGLDQWLVAPLRERLQRCVSEGEGDNDVITKKVRAAYREWKTKRIDEQLDDVLMNAHGRGVLAAFRTGTPVTWGIDRRHDACADCDDNALAGAVDSGDEFPTGDTFAPAHPGCRCMLLRVGR
jgi:DivIVA domain-containing protein